MSITINFDEKDIEDFLCTDNNLMRYLNLRFIARQVDIFGFKIDILAYNRLDKCFYIIELKKDDLSAKAFAQAFKYLRLMNIKYNKFNYKHDFKMLIIGQNFNSELIGALAHYKAYSEDNPNYLYTLYSYNFKDGIEFNYYNKAENNFNNNLKESLYE